MVVVVAISRHLILVVEGQGPPNCSIQDQWGARGAYTVLLHSTTIVHSRCVSVLEVGLYCWDIWASLSYSLRALGSSAEQCPAEASNLM